MVEKKQQSRNDNDNNNNNSFFYTPHTDDLFLHGEVEGCLHLGSWDGESWCSPLLAGLELPKPVSLLTDGLLHRYALTKVEKVTVNTLLSTVT